MPPWFWRKIALKPIPGCVFSCVLHGRMRWDGIGWDGVILWDWDGMTCNAIGWDRIDVMGWGYDIGRGGEETVILDGIA